MRVDLVRPGDLGPAEIASWHGMQRAIPSLANPFLSPEFAITVDRVRPESRVAVLADDCGRPGFFPFEKRQFGAGVPISGWLSACQGIIHEPGAQWDVSELLRGCELSAWQFDNLLADQDAFKSCHLAIAPSPVIDLTENFADYYAKLRTRASRSCRELERKARKLGREVGDLHLVCDSSDPALLRLLMAWKSEQYRRTNHLDRFERLWVVDLLEELHATRTENLSGLLSALYVGDRPVSVQFGLRAGNLLVGWFAGYDAQFAKYSPGLIQISLMIEALPAMGVNTLHMGKGAKHYTQALRNRDIYVCEGVATSRTWAGAAYQVRSAATSRALRFVREHPALHDAADLVLRRTGVSSLTYGRILSGRREPTSALVSHFIAVHPAQPRAVAPTCHYGWMRNFAASEAHLLAANEIIPGGAHTYAKGDDQYPVGMAPVIERGAGFRVWDLDGNEYIEFGSGLRANLLGHGFEPVLRAAQAAMADGVSFVRPHRLELEASERLVSLIPSAEMVKFGVNGSDVTTAAVRLARAYTGRDMVAICKDHPFFSTDDWFIGTTAMPAGVPAAVKNLSVQFSYNDLPSLARLFERQPGQIAAVILEPETVEPPGPGFFDGMRDLCDRHGALLILDETITGFRWHERGAQFVYGIRPDLCTFSKGLANGYPLSVLAGRRDVMRLGGFTEDADRVFLLSQTFGAQPWALAAMLAVIDTCERENISARLHQIGADLRTGIEEVVADAGLTDHFQLRGRDCNLVYVARDAACQPSQAFRTLVLQELLERGILAPSFVVCAAHDSEAVKRTVDAVAELMPTYRRALESGIEHVLRGRPVRPAVRVRG